MADRRSLGANLASALGGEAIQAALGVAIFFGLFFQLDDRDWGLYISVTTTGLIIGTLTNLGSQELLVRNVARHGNLAVEWGQTLVTQFVGASVGLGVGMLVRPFFFSELHWLTSFILLVFNIFFFWLVETTVRVGQATDDLSIGTRGRLYFAIGRLTGIGGFAVLGTGNINDYAILAAPLTLLGTGAALRMCVAKTRTRPRFQAPTNERLIRGLPFVGTAGAQDLLSGFDRPLLSANGLIVETGQYGIADRIARIASIPTMALVRATAADFFRAGAHDNRTTFRLAVRYARPAIAYGVCATGGVALFAHLLQGNVPGRIEPVLPMLVALAALPALQAAQLFPANVLTGTDRQSVRLVLYLTAAGVNIGLNILWIPKMGWQGAALATVIAESLLAALLWIVAWQFTRNNT